MDIGKIVSWIQLALWVVAVFLYAGKLLANEGATSSSLLGRLFTSTLILGIIVLSGLITSAAALFMNFKLAKHRYDESTKLEEIQHKVYMNEAVALDGKFFKRCRFVNVTYKYNGRGGVGLQDCTFSGARRLSSDSEAVIAAWVVAKGLGLMQGVPFLGPEGEPNLNVRDPKPSPSAKPPAETTAKGKGR